MMPFPSISSHSKVSVMSPLEINVSKNGLLIHCITFIDYQHDPNRSDAEENKYMAEYIERKIGNTNI